MLVDANEVSALISCECGTEFWTYLSDTLYKCPDCDRFYVVELHLKVIQEREKGHFLVGHK